MRYSPLLVLLLLLPCAVVEASQTPGQTLSQPYLPANDAVVLQDVPTAVDPRVRRFELLRKEWELQPKDLKLASALATAYLSYGRGTGDARYLGRADAVIAPWLQQTPPPLQAMLIDATILQSRHLFAESQAELQEVLKRDPDSSQAWLTLATVAQVRGEMETARNACSHLFESGDALVIGACFGALRAVTGHPKDAYDAMQTLLSQDRRQDPALQSWVQGLLADAAVYMGADALADAHYRAALQLSPGDNFLLADYGDFLIARNRPQEAIDLLKDYTQSDTSFLRLAIAENHLQVPQAEADAQQMAARFAATDDRGSYLYRREEALYELALGHDPARALKMAQQNWSVQRAPQDAEILLEAALFAGQPEAGQPILDFIAKTGLQEPKIDALAERTRKALEDQPKAGGGQ